MSVDCYDSTLPRGTVTLTLVFQDSYTINISRLANNYKISVGKPGIDKVFYKFRHYNHELIVLHKERSGSQDVGSGPAVWQGAARTAELARVCQSIVASRLPVRRERVQAV